MKARIPAKVVAIAALPITASVLLLLSTKGDPQKLLSHNERSPKTLFAADVPDDRPLLEGLRQGGPLSRAVDQSVPLRPSLPTAQDLSCSPAPCVLPNLDVSVDPTPFPKSLANETPIVVNPNNPQQLLAGANDDYCSNGMAMFASDDGGNTWQHACMPNFTGGYSGVDPGVAYDLLGGAYATSLEEYDNTTVAAIVKSTDNGKTWSAPTAAVLALLGGTDRVDKDWLEIDTNPHSPYVNALYISATQLTNIESPNSEISVSHSTNGGQTWATVAVDSEQIYPNIDQFSDLAIGEDGTVYVTWLRCTFTLSTDCGGTTATFEMATSTDEGNTWTAPQPIFTTTLAPFVSGTFCGYGCLPNTKASVSNIPVLGIDKSTGPHNGNLYVVYYNWTGTYMQVLVATSIDSGNTWTHTPVAPANDTHDQFFPWMSVSDAGVIGVSWLDRRNDPNNVNYEAFAAFSTNGGRSFGKNFDLSGKPSNPSNDGYGGHFLGDYSGNTWAGTKRFLVTYTDTTMGVGQDFIAGVQGK